MINKTKAAITFFVLTIVIASAFSGFHFYKKWNDEKRQQMVEVISNSVTKSLLHKEFPEELEFDDESYQIVYTLDNAFTQFIEKLVKRYSPDHASVVVMDNNSGAIISAVDYSRKQNDQNYNLTFSSTHPAASVFKIVTAAELLESGVEKDTVFNYRGKSTTLYKYQLKNKITKWSRYQNLKKAFAISNNVIFGKAAINNIEPTSLFQTAVDFGFNAPVMKDVKLPNATFRFPKSDYNLAELSSGFNKQTLISPIHAAMFSSIISNDGIRKNPYLIEKVMKNNEIFWSTHQEDTKVLDKHVAKGLQEMMNYTVQKGTARSAFRRFKRRWQDKLIVGGKTGSITGGIPFGKRDWFTAYAMPKNGNDRGISICVMLVNKKKWRVKSTVLSSMIIEHYYKKIKTI